MGLNIAGITITKNYENDIAILETILGEKMIFEKEITFEDACESFKEDTYCDIYFSENGTLVLCGMEKAAFEFYADTQDVFSFVLSEMTMTFCLNYVKNGKLVRTIIEAEDEIQEDEGTPLEIENTEEDKDELIYFLIEQILGESFHEIDLESKCKRFILKPIAQTDSSSQKNTTKKPWWKIW